MDSQLPGSKRMPNDDASLVRTEIAGSTGIGHCAVAVGAVAVHPQDLDENCQCPQAGWAGHVGRSATALGVDVGHFLISLAYGGLLLFIAEGNHSPVVKIGSIIGGAGIAMSIAHWLSSLFAPPLSQAHFDRAMAEQTEIIKEGNAQVVAAVQEGNAQVVAALSELTQQVSELSGDIRALLEALRTDAGVHTRPGDADD